MAYLAYTDIISLAEAKIYLRIDDTQNETDAEITSMINAAFRFIEKQTNHISYARDVSHDVLDDCIRIYDYPINSVTDPSDSDDYDQESKNLYSIFTLGEDSITVNVGYSADYPDDLRQAVLQLIKVWYYEADKQANTTLIPMSVKEVIDSNRRFLI